MGFDSNGNFKRVSGPDGWKEDKSQDIKILASRHDVHDQDMADGLNASLLADGRKAMSGSLKMGNNQVKNLAPGTAATDAVTAAQAQSLNFNYADDISSTANEVVIALSPGLTAQPNALFAVVKIANTNTGAATLKVNGLAAKRILFGTSEIYEGTLQAGSCYLFIYNKVLDAYQLIISGVNAASAPLFTLVFSESLLSETQKYGLELQSTVCPRSKYWEAYDMLAAEYATAIDRTETVSGTTFAFKEATDTKRRFYEKEVYNERFTLCGDSGGYVLDTELQRFTLPKTKNFFRPNMDALLANVYNPDENREHYHGVGERGPSNTGAFLENEDRDAEAFDLVSPNTRGWNGSGGSAPGGTSSGNLHFITSYDKATDTNQVSPRSKNIFVYYRVGGYSASSVPAGTADYTNLSNLPSIGGKTLVPGMSLGDLGITDNALLAYKNLPETFGAVSLTEGVYKGTITNNIVFSLPTLSNPGRLTQIIAHLVIPSGKTVNFGTDILLRGSPTLPLDGTYFVIWTWHPQIAGWVCDVQKVGEVIGGGSSSNIETITATSGSVSLEANKAYKMTAQGNITITLPATETLDTDKVNKTNLHLRNEKNSLAISFPGVIMFKDGKDFSAIAPGHYYICFEYNSIAERWEADIKQQKFSGATVRQVADFSSEIPAGYVVSQVLQDGSALETAANNTAELVRPLQDTPTEPLYPRMQWSSSYIGRLRYKIKFPSPKKILTYTMQAWAENGSITDRILRSFRVWVATTDVDITASNWKDNCTLIDEQVDAFTSSDHNVTKKFAVSLDVNSVCIIIEPTANWYGGYVCLGQIRFFGE